MKNEKEILEICKKERKIILKKHWLFILFFVAAAVVGIVYCKVLSMPMVDHGEFAGKVTLIALSIFAGLIISGYFYYKFLSKKLDRLWEQKKLLF